MNLLADWSWSSDGWIVVTGILGAVAAAIPGNFLVLRRMSMLGDAISHAILPGLVVAFLITGSRASVPMFLGAAVVGVLTAFFTEWVSRFGEVEEGAAMGVVFTTLFALGLVGVVQAADHVDIDPGCVLYGSIEQTPLRAPVVIAGWQVPPVVVVQGSVLLINLLFVTMCWKELQLATFDPSLAAAAGLSPRLMHFLLMVSVAVTAVASFESLGNILVVAMFVVPPSTAFLLTRRLSGMVVLSCLLASASAVIGHLSAIAVPRAFGVGSVSTSGMMALSSGLLFGVTVVLAPDQGLLMRFRRQRELTRRILSEDLIALLYRIDERRPGARVSLEELQAVLRSPLNRTVSLLKAHARRGEIEFTAEGLRLTSLGRSLGAELVRSHRLWEHYLASEGQVSVDRLHGQAERLEHFTSRDLRERLHDQSAATETDPHGRPIPEA
jgi:manganese/zinc/iron transport system permease protein